LAIPAGSAVITIERTHLSGGRPVETADIVVPADKYRLVYRFSVPGGPA
jgi:GntR family transcriptional regulator